MKRCKLLIILNFILRQNCFAKIIEKVTYQFSKDPIDIVILCHKKDVRTLDLVIIVSFLFMFGILFYVFNLTKQTQIKVEKLVREIALKKKK